MRIESIVASSGKEKERLNETPSLTSEQFDIEEERLRHWARFDKKALEHVERNILKRVLDWNTKLSAMGFAQIEAERDDVSFEKRKDAEYEMWEKKLQVVIDRLKIKRDNPDSPEAKQIRPLLLIMGGGMKGTYAAGQALVGLPAVGMDEDIFDNVVGISSGACIGSYFVGNGDHKAQGAKVFYDQCHAGDFLKFTRLHQIMNVDVIIDIMESDSRDSLDQEHLMNSSTNFFVGAVNQENGESEIINAKTAKPGLTTAIAASMAVPLVYRKAIEVNGANYVDGAFDPLPLSKMIEECNPTDILILPNVPFDKLDAFKLSKGQWLFAEFAKKMGSIGSLGTMRKFLMIIEELRGDLEDASREEEVNIGVVWPPDSGISPISQNPDDARETVAQSALDLIKRFGGKEKQVKDLNLPRRTVLAD